MHKKALSASMMLLFLTPTISTALTTTSTFAEDVIDDVAITVPSACSFTNNTTDGNFSRTLNNNHYESGIGSTTFTITCNDIAGFSVYAIGYSGEEYGTTDMLPTPSSLPAIPTGTATSGNNSAWAMKLTPVSGTYAPTIQSDTNGSFANYHVVPSTFTKVATFTQIVDGSVGSSMTSDYAVFISPTQPAGTYTGKVKYTIVHPNDAAAPTIPPTPPVSCPTPVPNVTYMQDITSSNKSSVLTSMTEDAQYYLADKRDNKAYCVAKLKDGNIWMTQNLDFDIGSTTLTHNSTTLYHDDTDLGYGNSSNQSWTPDKATYATGVTTWDTSTTGNNIQQSYDSGNKIWDGITDPDWETILDDMAQGTNLHYHLGNYYNWSAAVAINDTSSLTTRNTDVDQSICPANWTLPKAGDNTSAGSFQYLVNQYGWNGNSMTNPYIWESPLYFSLGGHWFGGSHGAASYDDFWSPVVLSGSYAYYLDVSESGSVKPRDFGHRYLGESVRCVSR